MSVITRYLIRVHVGPFVFALVAMTALVFLNAVARQVDALVGKGLPWSAIVEFLILSLPHTIALSLPIAVLASVLYGFSELTSSNEITALAANGVSPARVLAPILALGAVASVVMLAFNDRILPESNHRLKNLTFDIGRKSPTLEWREKVVNRIQTGITVGSRTQTYFLTADRIDPESNELTSVAIYDGNNPSRRRVTFADNGHMAFSQDQTDLYLTLYNGVVNESISDRIGGFRRIYFDKEVIPLRNIGTELERRFGGERSDREMGFALLRENARAREAELDTVKAQLLESSLRAVRLAIGRGSSADEAARDSLVRTRIRGVTATRSDTSSSILTRDATTRAMVLEARGRASHGGVVSQAIGRFEVEIHKKAALAVACLIFTLIGPPLAIRFPTGGIGMVVSAAGCITAVYWAGLIGGENLADRGSADPAITMWAANVIFLMIGLWLALTMGRTRISLRSGAFDGGVGRILAKLMARRGKAARTVAGGEAT